MKTFIRTSLPFFLYLQDGPFLFSVEGQQIELIVRKCIVERSRRTVSRSGFTFVRQDRWGIDEYSAIEMIVDRPFSSQDTARSFAVRAINQLIDAYRYIAQAPHVMGISNDDLFEFSAMDEGGHGSAGVIFPGGLTMGLEHEITSLTNRVKQALSEGFSPPLYEMFLLNAKHYLFTGELRVAIVEAVIGLELALNSFLRIKLTSSGMERDSVERIVQRERLTSKITTILASLLPQSELEKLDISGCMEAIDIRNRVVHRGESDLKKEKVEKVVDSATITSKLLAPHIGSPWCPL